MSPSFYVHSIPLLSDSRSTSVTISASSAGTPTPINQVAGISVPEARLIVIQPWDLSILKEIEKAILASDIGINPNNDGKVIRLSFPELTEERRKELVKDIKKTAEEDAIANGLLENAILDIKTIILNTGGEE